jgi:hypothetical protein
MKSVLLISFLLLAFSISCNRRPSEETGKSNVAGLESYHGVMISDTIVYDVIIRNPDPQDDWTTFCLKNLKRTKLIDDIFDLVYSGKIEAYDFFTKSPLMVKDVQKLESQDGYSRDHIGKIQFAERWYFDKNTRVFQKEIISMVFGYEIFNSDGTLRGYKPVFKVFMNH